MLAVDGQEPQKANIAAVTPAVAKPGARRPAPPADRSCGWVAGGSPNHGRADALTPLLARAVAERARHHRGDHDELGTPEPADAVRPELAPADGDPLSVNDAAAAPTLHRNAAGGAAAQAGPQPRTRLARAVLQRATYEYQQVVDSFQPGDLIYGLTKARAPTVRLVRDKMSAADSLENEQQAAAILDELSNVFLGTGTRADPYGTRKMGYRPSPAVSEQAAAFQRYLEADEKYSPILREIRGKPLADKRRGWERIKKSCKAGLVYTTQADHQIYFVLDELDMTDVVRKLRWSDPDEPLGKKARARKFDPATGDAVGDITGAELRSLYRLRGDDTVMNNVTFWKNGTRGPVDSPWDAAPKLWRNYVPKREKRPSFFSRHFRGK